MPKYTYENKTDKKGNVFRYRVWKEEFKDEDTGESIFVKRRQLSKVNGERVYWYSNSELAKLSKKQRDSIKIQLIE